MLVVGFDQRMGNFPRECAAASRHVDAARTFDWDFYAADDDPPLEMMQPPTPCVVREPPPRQACTRSIGQATSVVELSELGGPHPCGFSAFSAVALQTPSG